MTQKKTFSEIFKESRDNMESILMAHDEFATKNGKPPAAIILNKKQYQLLRDRFRADIGPFAEIRIRKAAAVCKENCLDLTAMKKRRKR